MTSSSVPGAESLEDCGNIEEQALRELYMTPFRLPNEVRFQICHKSSGRNSDFWNKFFAPAMEKYGYICCAIDCISP